ncbi:MAG TPA: phosphatase PAP2 family protein [Chloroflexota bacterium]|nr:phosphatase PAP2 family protein [Chloroflexota bacterium]
MARIGEVNSVFRLNGQATSPASIHRVLLNSAVALLCLAMFLLVLVVNHRGPLPYDVNIELGLQHLLRHSFLAGPVEMVSTVGWPIPSTVTVVVILLCFLALRRWLDALLIIPIAVLCSLSNLLTADLVKRPRPQGHGIWVMEKVTHYFSFPSGHVVFATAVWGFVVFLTWRALPGTAWVWIPRILGLAIIIVMPVSRVLEGEHWPSDVVEGALYGAIWLLLAIVIYEWAAARHPRLLGIAELGRGAGRPATARSGGLSARPPVGSVASTGQRMKETHPSVKRT